MNCLACKSPEVESAGAPIRTGGAVYFPHKCSKCGFFWSDKAAPAPPAKAPAPPAAPAAAPELKGVPPADAPAPAVVPPAAPAPAPAKRRGLFGKKST